MIYNFFNHSSVLAITIIARTLIVISLIPTIYCRIQYIRHLHEKVKSIDDRTAPPKEEKDASDNAGIAAAYGMVSGRK